MSLAALHLGVAICILANGLYHPAVIDGAESMHAFFAYEAATGMRLYGPVDPHVLELWYTPLAFQLAGAVSSLFGFDIRTMRLVQGLFGIGAVVVLGMTVFRMTRFGRLAFIASGIFGGFVLSGRYYILSPNSLHLLCALLAVYLLVRDPELRWTTVLWTVFALFACFWSKQTGLAYIAAGLFYICINDWRKGVAATLLACALVTGFAGYYIFQPDSSFLSMIFMHKNDPIVWKWLFTPVLYPEILGRFGILVALVAAGMMGLGIAWRNWVRPEYVFLGAGAVVALSCSIKYGSSFGSQGYFFAGMLIICAVDVIYNFLRKGRLGWCLAAALLLVQVALLFIRDYSHDFITVEDDARYKQIIGLLKTPGRNVHYINQPFYSVVAGTKPYPSVSRSCWLNGTYDRSLYPEKLRKFYAQDPFDIIIVDLPLEDNSWMLYERIQANYAPVMEIPPVDARLTSPHTLRNKKIIFYRKDLVGPQDRSPRS